MNIREKFKTELAKSSYNNKTTDEIVALLNTTSDSTTPAKTILSRDAVAADVNAANMLLPAFLATAAFTGLSNEEIAKTLNAVSADGAASLTDINLGRSTTLDDIISAKGE